MYSCVISKHEVNYVPAKLVHWLSVSKVIVVATDGDVCVYVDFDTGVSRSYCPVDSGGWSRCILSTASALRSLRGVKLRWQG